MAVKKTERRPITSDPAVEAAMPDGLYGDLARARGMTAEERRRAERKSESAARRKAEQAKRDAARNKTTFDLPKEITDEIERLARQDPEFRVPPSHIVAVLLHHALRDLEEGEIDLWSHRVRSNVPRFDYFLKVDPEGEE